MTASELEQKISISVSGRGVEMLQGIREKIDGIGAEAVSAGSRLSGMAEAGKKASLAFGAGVLAGGVALTAFGASAVGAASDIAESQNKVNVVFGESAGVINDLAATAATALGQTKAEVLSAAGGIGNLLTAMGQGKAEAAEMSVGMVKLAADLGSFNNASSTDVLAAMQAAMAGETEGMKKYGVAINEATLKQAAMAAGMGDNVQALSAVQKQQLSWSIMLEQTKSAQGDFANTSDGMANSMKIVKAGLADAKAEIGAGLLPAVEKATAAFSTFLKSAKFDELKDKVIAAFAAIGDKLAQIDWESLADTAVGVFDKITAAVEFLAENPTVAKIVAALALIASTFGVIMVAIGPFIPIIMSVVGAIGSVVTAAGGLSAILATVAAVLTGPVAIAIGIAIAAFVLWRAKGDEIKAALSAAWEGIKSAFADGAAAVNQKVGEIQAAGAALVATIVSHADTIKAVLLTIITGGWYLVYVAWQQYGDQIKAKAAELVAWIKQKWEDLKAGTLAKWNEIKAAISAAIESARAKIAEVLAAIRAVWDTAWAGIGAGAAAAWQTVVDLITAGVDFVLGIMRSFADAQRAAFALAWDTITLLVDAAWKTIQGLVQVGVDYVRAVIQAGMQLLQGDWRGAWATLHGAAQSAIDRVKAIVGGLASWLGGLKDSVLQRAMDIGRSLGDGIRNALQTGWDAVLNKLRALVDLLPDTVKRLLGIASPSKVFEEIGTWISIGLASGIQKADSKAIEALANMVAKITAVADGVVSFGKKLAEAVMPTDDQIAMAKEKYLRMTLVITDFVKTISYLGSLLTVRNSSFADSGQKEGINAGLIVLSQAFPAIKELQGMQYGKLLTGGEADWASKLADVVGKLASVWGGLADNLTKMANATIPSEPQLNELKEATIRLALWAADSFKTPTIPAVGAQEFAASLKAVTDALATVAGLGLAGAVKITSDDLEIVKDNLVLIWGRFADITRAWRENLDDDARAAFVSGVSSFASAIKAARDALDAGVISLDDLKGLTVLGDTEMKIIKGNLLEIWMAIATLSAVFRTSSAADQQAVVDGFKRFAEAMGAALDMAKLANVGALKAEIEIDLKAVQDVLIYLRDILVPAMEDIVFWWSTGTEAAKRSTESMQAFAGWIGAALSIAKASEVGELKADIKVDMVNLEAILGFLRDVLAPAMEGIVAAWTVAEKAAKEQTERMQAFAGWISAAVALAKTTEVGELKADIKVDMVNMIAILDWLRTDFVPAVRAIAEKWGEAVEVAKAQTEQMQSFAGWIGAAVAVAKASEVGELKSGILVNMTSLTTTLEWMRTDFVPAIRGIVDKWGETAETAKPLVEKMQAFASVIKAAVDIAKGADVGSLAAATSPAKLGDGLAAVKANVLAVFAMVGEIAKDITLAEATARADLAEALGRGMKGLGDFAGGIGSLLSLAESRLFGSAEGTAGSGFTQRTRTRRADFFAEQLRDTVQRAVKAMQDALAGINIKPDDPKTAAIAQLGEAFGNLADGIKALADTKLPDASRLAAVVAALALVPGGAGGGVGGGAFNVASVTVETATVESVTLGDIVMGDTHVYIDGREIARAVADTFINDVKILDDLGKALGERQARRP